jgi:twitching motility protein PilT
MSHSPAPLLVRHLIELALDQRVVFSDAQIEEDQPIMLRTPMGWKPSGYQGSTSAEDIKAFLDAFDKGAMNRMDDDQSMEETGEFDGVRLRCSAYAINAGQNIAASVRVLPSQPPMFEETGLPASVAQFASRPRGLLLVTGPTGSGKTTTMASLLRMINERRSAHVITIEDPIEFHFRRDKAIFSHRQVGKDVKSFAEGLRQALRQSYDVLMIGEIRDRETAETALRAAESGRLVMASLHSRNASSAVSKMLSYFGGDAETIAVTLANSLVGVVAQCLVPTVEGKYTLAAEILVNDQNVPQLVSEMEFQKINTYLKDGVSNSCTYMNRILLNKVVKGEISLDSALLNSPDPSELKKAHDEALKRK